MKKYIYIALISIAIAGVSSSFITSSNEVMDTVDEKLTWFVDFNKANEESKKVNKPIFAFFTGSDWCGWCRKLQADVFAKEAFIKWAQKEVVLLELDFPRRKAIPANIKKTNQELARLLNVRGYPTIHIFNTQVNKKTNQVNLNLWGQTGYPSGAVKGKEEVKFLAAMEQIFATQKK